MGINTTYRMAKTGILHLNQDFIVAHSIQHDILENKRCLGSIDHKCLGRDLLFGNHSGGLSSYAVRRFEKLSILDKPGREQDEADPDEVSPFNANWAW